MPNPEVKISEVNPAEQEQVVSAIVREWMWFRDPEREDRQPFRRGDITVRKITVPEVTYPIYVCVPRDMLGGLPPIDVKKPYENEGIYHDISIPFRHGQIVKYKSVLLKDQGGLILSMENTMPHDLDHGEVGMVALPDITEIRYAYHPLNVEEKLQGQRIQSMVVMCGFTKQSLMLQEKKASIAIFTKPIVK